MPTIALKFTAAEIAAILADHIERTRTGTRVDPKNIHFDIAPACNSADPREWRPSATLTGATVPATE